VLRILWSLLLKFQFSAKIWCFCDEILVDFWNKLKISAEKSQKSAENWNIQKKAPKYPPHRWDEGTIQFWGLSNHLTPKNWLRGWIFGPFFTIWGILYISRHFAKGTVFAISPYITTSSFLNSVKSSWTSRFQILREIIESLTSDPPLLSRLNMQTYFFRENWLMANLMQKIRKI
jgi:hypothetical protein